MSPLVREHLLVMEHLLDEPEKLEPEWYRFTEFTIKCSLKIHRVRTGETVKHNSILAISYYH